MVQPINVLLGWRLHSSYKYTNFDRFMKMLFVAHRSWNQLTGEGNSETSMHVKLRLIFRASLSVASMAADHSSWAAAKPTAFGKKIQTNSLFLACIHCYSLHQPNESAWWFAPSISYTGQRLSEWQSEYATEGLSLLQHGRQMSLPVPDLSTLHIYGQPEVTRDR